MVTTSSDHLLPIEYYPATEAMPNGQWNSYSVTEVKLRLISALQEVRDGKVSTEATLRVARAAFELGVRLKWRHIPQTEIVQEVSRTLRSMRRRLVLLIEQITQPFSEFNLERPMDDCNTKWACSIVSGIRFMHLIAGSAHFPRYAYLVGTLYHILKQRPQLRNTQDIHSSDINLELYWWWGSPDMWPWHKNLRRDL